MAVLQALIATLFRYAGKILNTALGWATILLFGKVSQKRQIYLSLICIMSLIWMVFAVGIAFPRAAAFLLAFAKIPDSVNPNWIRLAMLACTLFFPAGVGAVSFYMLDPGARPKTWKARLKMTLKGYPYTLGLSITLLLMVLFAPALKLRMILRRWTTAHTPLIIPPDSYDAVVRKVRDVLTHGGFPVERVQANWMIRLPTALLTFFARNSAHSLVGRELTTLRSPQIEVLIHPSDLVTSGKEPDVVRVRALLSENVSFEKAYMTWSKESNALEDRFREVWEKHEKDGAGHGAELKKLDAELRKLKIPYEEWEILFRKKVMLERGILEASRGEKTARKDARRHAHA